MTVGFCSSSNALLDHLEQFPLVFTYEGVDYYGFKSAYYNKVKQQTNEEHNKTTVELQFRFLDELDVGLEWTIYHDCGLFEWRVLLENNGTKPSGIISNLRSEFAVTGDNPVLKGIRGDHYNQYTPYAVSMDDRTEFFESNHGRSTHIQFPYFNLEYGDVGVLLAIGWAGTWTASFSSQEGKTQCMLKAVNNMHTYLKPGEHITSARFVCMPYKGRKESCIMNRWRKWFVENNLPSGSDTDELTPFMTGVLSGETVKLNGEIPIDAEGIQTIHKFEPTLVKDLDVLVKHHGYDPSWAVFTNNQYHYRTGNNLGDIILNNIADPECYQWTRDRILQQICDDHIPIFHEDSSGVPAPAWQYQDWVKGNGQRDGMTECKTVEARYRLLDEVTAYTAKQGGCSFALYTSEGGGLSDLETLRRALPMVRCEYENNHTNRRLSVTSTLNQWIPFCGVTPREKQDGQKDAYIWRSAYLPILNLPQGLIEEPEQFQQTQRYINERRRVCPYLLKNFYSLKPYVSAEDATGYTAFCYYDEESDEGVILLFRREQCPDDSVTVCLPFLHKDRCYQLEDSDLGIHWQESGAKLTDICEIKMPEKRSSKIVWFQSHKEDHN